MFLKSQQNNVPKTVKTHIKMSLFSVLFFQLMQLAGLQALYTVRSDCGWEAVERPLMGQIREYFIGAVNTSWNYAPTGMNTILRTSLTDPTQ